MNRHFELDENSFSEANIVSGLHRVMDKGMVRESIIKMKTEKAARPSELVSEIVK